MYAGGDAASANNGTEPDEADLYGISQELVQEFESQGFQKDRIIEVLRRLGIKSLSPDDNDTVNRVIEELLE